MRKPLAPWLMAVMISSVWCSAGPLPDNFSAFADFAAGERVQALPVETVQGKPVSPLYAAPVLQGATNEHISVVAMSASGERAILERITPGFLVFSGSTEIQLLTSSGGSWSESSLLSRKNGKGKSQWIGGVTLSALAFSADGKHLVYRWMKDIQDYKSTVLKVRNLDSGKESVLGAGKGGTVLEEDIREVAKVVSESDWFKHAYPGASYEEIFPNSRKRCAADVGVKASIEDRRTLIIRKDGADPFTYPLKNLPGTRAWAWQSGSHENTMSKDCGMGLTTVQEVLSSQSPSFFYGSNAYDAQMRVMEFGLR